MTDDETVAQAKAGDPDAWRELYRAHAGRLVTWLGARDNGDSALSADDVASEAWLVAASKIHGFSGDSSDFAGWLFGIARNLHSTTRRRSTRRQTRPGDVEEHHLGQVDDPTHLIDQQAWIRDVLSCLSQRERDVIGCVDVVGLDTAATARALGMSEVAVRVARHRGLKRLRSRRGDLVDPDDGGTLPGAPAPIRTR